MDLSQLANLGEFIGGIAVLVTLIYLAVQVRQVKQTVRNPALDETANSWREASHRTQRAASSRLFRRCER